MAEDNGVVRVRPHNSEAEQAVLGSMMMDAEAVGASMEILQEEDFYEERHRIIFRAISELYHENRAVDLVTLSDRLKQDGALETVGGLLYLGTIASSVPTSVNARHYARIVKDKSQYRRIISVSESILNQAYGEEMPIPELSEKVETDVFKILSNQTSQDFVHIREALMSAYDNIERNVTTKNGITGIPSGFTDLDKMTTGFQPSDLILLGARPSMGKTAMALNIVEHAAVREHKICAVFSLEMSLTQIASRLLCAEAMVDSNKVRSGQIEDEDWARLTAALGPLSVSPIYIDDTSAITLGEVRSKCRKLKLEHGLDLIMIDYLQLMSGSSSNSDGNRQQEISDISRGLKALAREMQAPVIALSQLSRAVESRTDKRPMLSDLRESGAIEQDADVVMFLYRDEYYHKDSKDHNIGELIIAKQRNGSIGTVKLAWLGQYTKFENLEQGSYAGYDGAGGD